MRNIRWRIPFASLAGVACHIDIYDEGYEGTITEISRNNANTIGWPDVEPFYYEEDTEKNVLKVVRSKTGYIKLIENNFGDMDVLFPDYYNQRYVEVYYGNDLCFVGFIRPLYNPTKIYSQHRNIALPVVSPLGLCEDIYIGHNTIPNFNTLGTLLSYAISALGVDYNYVVIPDPGYGTIYQGHFLEYWASKWAITSEAEYKPGRNQYEIYEDCSVEKLLESICRLYDMMLHETPGYLIFSKIGDNGYYCKIDVSNLSDWEISRTSLGRMNTDAEVYDYYSAGGNGNKFEIISPLSKLRLNYSRDLVPRDKLPFITCSRQVYVNDTETVVLTPINSEMWTQSAAAFPVGPSSSMRTPGTMICYYKGSEMIALLLDSSLPQNITWASIKIQFCNTPQYFSFVAMAGNNCEDLDEHLNIPYTVNITDSRGNTNTYNYSTGNDKKTIAFSSQSDGYYPGAVTIEFKVVNNSAYYGKMLILKESEFSEWGANSSGEQYATENAIDGHSTLFLDGAGYNNEEEIDITYHRKTYVSSGNTYPLRSTGYLVEYARPIGFIQDDTANYGMVLNPQQRLTLELKGTPPNNKYLLPYKIDGSALIWSLLSESFYPASDLYQLIFHAKQNSQ